MFFFDVHTHKISLDKNKLAVVNRYPNATNFSLPFSIGIHPWFIHQKNIKRELLIVEEKLQHQNCYAIGECGLDKITATNFQLQKEVFRAQIALSEKYQKPLIIHCVKSFQEIIELKKEIKPTQVWILHGFHKNLQVAKSVLKNGFIVSLGAAIINHKKLQEVILDLPLDAFLLETDDSEINIQEIYQKVASIKQIEVSVLQKYIKQNFKRIFKNE